MKKLLGNMAGWLRRRRRPAVVESEAFAWPEQDPSPYFHGGSKSYTRWWWLAGPFRREDITFQLEWARDNGFGGVELAWLWPSWMDDAEPGIDWLGVEWTELVAFTKQEADRLDLGCDFTFGSCWPFGGAAVCLEDASRTFDGFSGQRLNGSWEYGPQYVINHLHRGSLRRYALAMLPAFAPGLAGSKSALFCDSLEVDTRRLWDHKLWDQFEERFGYRLEGLEDEIDRDPALRYDYRATIAGAILREFYEEFAAICRRNGAISRVQCHGAPTDLLSAYAAVDIPESEAILFPPEFSRIAASAAALSGKTIVSCETFTCLYGFVTRTNVEPFRYWHKEQVADMKLLADAVFAQGINQIVWHGMPFNGPSGRNEFYASVHVGPDASFAREIPAFNGYLERVSALLRLGRSESRLAVYLPNEDNLRLDRIPAEERTPGAGYRWEMRHVRVPKEVEGHAPLWISAAFLERSRIEDGRLILGDCSFSAMLVDVEWLDGLALSQIVRLANEGLSVILPRLPRDPGRRPRPDYEVLLQALKDCPNVFPNVGGARLSPLVTGEVLPPFWARRTGDAVFLFFAHPNARDVRYPMRYGQSLCEAPLVLPIVVELDGVLHPIELKFDPYQSLLVRVSALEGVRFVDINYQPLVPEITVK